MLTEEKTKLMIRLADYEQSIGKLDTKRTKFYKWDYIRYQVLKTVFCVTIAVILGVVLYGAYNLEYLIANALELDYHTLGIRLAFIYGGCLVISVIISFCLALSSYEASKKRVKGYYATLQELMDYYKEEEEEGRSL